jgi:hypothetical protein
MRFCDTPSPGSSLCYSLVTSSVLMHFLRARIEAIAQRSNALPAQDRAGVGPQPQAVAPPRRAGAFTSTSYRQWYKKSRQD